MLRKTLIGLVAVTLSMAVSMTSAGAAVPLATQLPGSIDAFGISCPTATLCWATGATGDTADHGQGFLVKIVDGVPGPVVPVPGTAEINSISCPTASFCEAQADVLTSPSTAVTALVAFHNGKPAKIHQGRAGTGVYAVSCASAQTCEAVGVSGPADDPDHERPFVQVIKNGKPGKLHTVSQAVGLGSELTAVSCLPTGSCVAVGGGVFGKAQVFKSYVISIASNGTPGLPKYGAAVSLQGVSCVSASVCVAVGSQSIEAHPTTGVVVPITNGSPGSIHTIANNTMATSVSCAGASCQAVGFYRPDPNNTVDTSGTLISVNAGGSSSAHAIAGAAELFAVSCPTGGPCASAGTTSNIPGQIGAVVTVKTDPKKAKLTLRAAPKHPTIKKPITFTLTVKRLAGASRATGRVTFSHGKKALCSDVALRSAKANAAAVCKVAAKKLGVGKATIKASYDGDINYQPGSATAKVKVAK